MIESLRVLRHPVGNESAGLITIKDGDAKVQRGELTLPRSHSKQMLEPGQLLEPAVPTKVAASYSPPACDFGPQTGNLPWL